MYIPFYVVALSCKGSSIFKKGQCVKLGLGEKADKATGDLKWSQTMFLDGCLFCSRSCHGCEVGSV